MQAAHVESEERHVPEVPTLVDGAPQHGRWNVRARRVPKRAMESALVLFDVALLNPLIGTTLCHGFLSFLTSNEWVAPERASYLSYFPVSFAT